MTAQTCGNCANASCERAGLVETCERWSNTDDSDVDTDLAPLSPEECERRGIRHSSCDDNRLVEFDILWGCDLRNAARSVGL